MSLGPFARRFRRLNLQRGDVALLIIVAMVVLVALVVQAVRDDQPWDVLLVSVALPAVYLRRRRPLVALALAIVPLAFWPDGALLLPALVVLYSFGAAGARRLALGASAAVVAVCVIAAAVHGTPGTTDHGGLLGLGLSTTAFCGAAVAIGLYVGAQRRVLEALRERAELADRERELLAGRAVAEERVRIAQELHDVVAHDISLMVVQAQALGATDESQPVRATTKAIADLGRDAMAEMHRTLRLLRSGTGETAELEPLPGLADLNELLERSRAAGLELGLTVEGQPHQLSQTADLSAFRIIQEALTNVIKHGESAPTAISISYGSEALRVAIRDCGARRNGQATRPRIAGHGITGMRERVALFGGTLTAGARPEGGFEVVATLPYEEIER
jgi:signal transduction histidine kinase